jgi:hypothetical protein
MKFPTVMCKNFSQFLQNATLVASFAIIREMTALKQLETPRNKIQAKIPGRKLSRRQSTGERAWIRTANNFWD